MRRRVTRSLATPSSANNNKCHIKAKTTETSPLFHPHLLLQDVRDNYIKYRLLLATVNIKESVSLHSFFGYSWNFPRDCEDTSEHQILHNAHLIVIRNPHPLQCHQTTEERDGEDT